MESDQPSVTRGWELFAPSHSTVHTLHDTPLPHTTHPSRLVHSTRYTPFQAHPFHTQYTSPFHHTYIPFDTPSQLRHPKYTQGAHLLLNLSHKLPSTTTHELNQKNNLSTHSRQTPSAYTFIADTPHMHPFQRLTSKSPADTPHIYLLSRLTS